MSGSRTVEPVGGPVAAAFQQRIEELEATSLCEHAQPSYPALRQHNEGGCELRTPFQRDRDRIVHSKSFRRLKYKTQVFISPLGDHYRTRLTHTLEVTQVSRTVARALRLNEDLTEAIGLGHDLGHPPFGHVGEDVLNENRQERYGEHFRHNEQSLRIVSVLEREGQGLNLTEQVRNGILNHTSGTPQPDSAEGRIVRLVDRIAYINHDIDDALRAGVITDTDLPQEEIAVLGNSGSERIDRLVHDLVEHSATAGDIVQGDQIGAAMLSLRNFMFENVYLGEAARREHSRIRHVINTLFAHYADNPEQLPTREAGADDGQAVIDYISGMTDRFCIRAFEAITVPEAFAE